jgi:triosephosphate isomerase (TIM)
MNHGLKETEEFFMGLKQHAFSYLRPTDGSLFDSGKLQACLIPPFLALEESLQLLFRSPFPINIAAQNAHWEKKGAFTGEISGPMLMEIGVQSVLIGHSERRQYFGETDETVRLRTDSLLSQEFQVILCVGETKEQREKGKTSAVLARQVKNGFPEMHHPKLVIAYEPVWAIGTGLTATPEQAEEAHLTLRKLLQKRWGKEAAEKTVILYGGSVTAENAFSLLSCPNVDGALVGGASLKPQTFCGILGAGARILAPEAAISSQSAHASSPSSV